MRNFLKTMLILVTLLIAINLSAQQQTQKSAAASASIQEPLKLTSSADSSQYILGAYLGQYLNANGLTITNVTLFLRGYG